MSIKNKNLLMPPEFIPIFSETGLGVYVYFS
jgi:hypothetical protein